MGIGFETALLLARSRFRTFATMRDLVKADRIKNTAEEEHLPLEGSEWIVIHLASDIFKLDILEND